MDNFTKLLNKTYRFLSYRQRSIKEVDDYLAKKKASSLDSKRIINKLKEQKFLDDELFAKLWIESRNKFKPRATRIIKFELKQKGIDKELIEGLFEDGEDLKSYF